MSALCMYVHTYVVHYLRTFTSLYSPSAFCVQQICDVSGLGHLSHLRVLNLAGNEITVVSGLFELKSLTELNLRRNRVRQVVSAKYVCVRTV